MLAGTLLLAGAGAANAAVVESDLNLRSGPGTGYGVVAVMPAGAQVDVLSCSGSWCRVAYGAAEGWASRSYLAGIGGPAYAAAPIYVEPPVYAYAPPPLFGFSFGFGGWHHGGRYHHWHHRWHH
jgi:uncharacterized protein YraI